MNARFEALGAALILCGCAAAQPPPQGFAFGVMGDTPYNDREEAPFLATLDRMGREPLAFVVHVGDFKAGSNAPCSDALYERRKAQFESSRHPLIYTPGDNEWTDCRRATNARADPLERLAKLRALFFDRDQSLGQRKIDTESQRECVESRDGACACPGYPENRMWTFGAVRFATLNFPGPDNNEGHGAATDAEARCRMAANRQWLARAAHDADAPGMRGLVVATQANPWTSRNYAPFLRDITIAAQRLGKPVLFVHGDTHTYRFDTPFVDAAGMPLDNPARLETYGSPFVGWERVTVDPGDPRLFRVEPMLHAVVR